MSDFVQIENREKFSEDEFWEMVVALDARKWANFLPPQLPIEDLSTKRERNFVTPDDTPIPDCLTCGVCCQYLFVIGVKPEDNAPAEFVWSVTDETGEVVIDSYLRRDAETLYCAALQPTEDGKMPCGIYENRPQACRKFEAGSDKCHALRRMYGYEPFLSVEEMLAALQVLKAKETKSVSPDTIRDAKIVKTETGDYEIVAELQNGTKQTIHTFDATRESWRQFQFSGLPLADARRLIETQSAAMKAK